MCYGVENASTVWLEPPRQELSAALSRCVEVFPEADTTYKLTAQGADGKPRDAGAEGDGGRASGEDRQRERERTGGQGRANW